MPPAQVSIVIVNYNGAHYLSACLDALRAQTYPAECIEVIVSDNGSRDGSLELLRQAYPWVQVLDNGQNLGFASGNNVAFEQAQGKYVVLLNNDTAPTPTWLENLVAVADADPQAGMVTGHLQLFYDQLELDLRAETFTPPGEDRQLGVQIYAVEYGLPRGITQYLQGFYGREANPTSGVYRWSQGQARLGVPVPPGAGEWPLHLLLSSGRPPGQLAQVSVALQGQQLAEWQVLPGAPTRYTLTIPAGARSLARPVEQNTGSIIFRSGAARDRGTTVRDNEVFYERDDGQYSQVEEVFAGCGASLLLRREMLDEIGWFDDDLFMYYEDTDLAWRARLRGWKVLYAPGALVRHIHCGTTKEWSAGFVHMTERNRLAMVFKNGPASQVARVWGGYLLKVFLQGFQAVEALLLRRPGWRSHFGQMRVHLRVIASLASWLPALWRKRLHIQRAARLRPSELQAWFVE